MLTKSFNDQEIRVRESDQYISLTDMAQAMGKRVQNWTQNQGTQDFLLEYTDVTGFPVTHLIQTQQGGTPNQQGTWAHPDVAIQFAQWCSPRFAIQVSLWIRELMTTGKVELKDSIEKETGELKTLQEQYDRLEKDLKDEKNFYTLSHLHRSYLWDVIKVLSMVKETEVKKWVSRLVRQEGIKVLMQEETMRNFYLQLSQKKVKEWKTCIEPALRKLEGVVSIGYGKGW